MKTPRSIVSAVIAGACIGTAFEIQAQTLWQDSFDVDSTANWSVLTTSGGAQAANVYFDYSSVGIPSAPNSAGGSTWGLRMQANIFGTDGAFPGGVSASTIGLGLAGDYRVKYDMWINFNGPLDVGGSGSTQITAGGFGTAGSSVQVAGGAIDSLLFGASGDGGSSADYRVYSPTAQSSYQDASGVYAAGTTGSPRNNSNPYYAGCGGESAPAAQLGLYPGQTLATAVGALGFAWRDVTIEKIGDTVTWSIDGTLIATVDATGMTLGGGELVFSQFDINATASGDANSVDLQFGLIDNVRVEVIPEPTALVLLGLGGVLMAMPARRRR
ncbi:MAG TPA: PEP-CTERM sorting domain-containing protein [Candidatus Paceibacterota bacterium]|nr:PEP-CTERM sorting domain-containing protein [Candidatus Paceibacterota bacterium]